MKQTSYLLSTTPLQQTARVARRITPYHRFQRRLLCEKLRQKSTGKELDRETGLYYFGARYLDPRTSRWLSVDPAIWQGDLLPSAPINDEARERNQNLPGHGGVFNVINLHVFSYAGNNPVKYIDPDGRFLINTVDPHRYFPVPGAAGVTVREFAMSNPGTVAGTIGQSTRLGWIPDGAGGHTLGPINSGRFQSRIRFENNMDTTLNSIATSRSREPSALVNDRASVRASAVDLGGGLVGINITTRRVATDPSGRIIEDTPNTATIAFTTREEINRFGGGQAGVNNIANRVLRDANINLRVDQ